MVTGDTLIGGFGFMSGYGTGIIEVSYESTIKIELPIKLLA